MKAINIRYERLVSTGNFEHEKVGIELAVEPGETASDVLARAKAFCAIHAPDHQLRERVEEARRILGGAAVFPRDRASAQAILDAHAQWQRECQADIPF